MPYDMFTLKKSLIVIEKRLMSVKSNKKKPGQTIRLFDVYS